MSPAARESVITVRVNYSETDQMGVVYHARYVVWLDMKACCSSPVNSKTATLW